MIKLNTYIYEAWSGVKQQSLKSNIEAWCEEMGIEKYTINSKGEIDVNGDVDLRGKDFKELPFKFETVTGCFSIKFCENLISLKNCPDYTGGWFSCSYNQKLNSLEGCPEEVGNDFWCKSCKKKFTKKYVMSLCEVKGDIMT